MYTHIFIHIYHTANYFEFESALIKTTKILIRTCCVDAA